MVCILIAMAHILIIELPDGDNADVVTAALARGDTFSFLTENIAAYRRKPRVASLLSRAQAIIEVPGFDYDAIKDQVLPLHRTRAFSAIVCLVDRCLLDAARLAHRLGLAHIGRAEAMVLQDPSSVREVLAGVVAVGHYRPRDILVCDVLSTGANHRLMGIHDQQLAEGSASVIGREGFATEHPQWDSINAFVQQVLDTLSFDWGASHIEMVLTPQGPRLLRLVPQLVNAQRARLAGFVMQRSLYTDLIAAHLGLSIDEIVGPVPQASAFNEPSTCGVIRWIVAAEDGRLEGVQVPTLRDPRVRCVEILKSPGDYVRRPQTNADRIGYVIACARTMAEAQAAAEDWAEQTRVVVRSGKVLSFPLSPSNAPTPAVISSAM